MNFSGSTLFNSAPLSASHHDAISCFWKQEFKTFLHIHYLLYHMDLSFAIVIIGFGTVKNFFLLVSLILAYSSSCSFLQQKLGFIFPWLDIFHGSPSQKWIEIPYNLTLASFYCHLLFSLHSNWIQLTHHFQNLLTRMLIYHWLCPACFSPPHPALSVPFYQDCISYCPHYTFFDHFSSCGPLFFLKLDLVHHPEVLNLISVTHFRVVFFKSSDLSYTSPESNIVYMLSLWRGMFTQLPCTAALG